MRFTSASFKFTASVLLLASTTGLAIGHSHHCKRPVDYKCEAPCPPPCPQNLMDGFYVGVGAGYDVITSDANFNEVGRIAITGNPRLAAYGWDAGGFLGYGKYFDVFYLGAEVFGNYTSASSSFTISGPLGSVHGNVRSNGDWGVALIPGIALNCSTLGYVRLGWDWANTRGNGRVVVNTEPPTVFSGNRSSTRNGFLFGVGLETLISCNWSLRGEFNYINFNNNDSSSRVGSRIRPSDNRYSLGIVYHFC